MSRFVIIAFLILAFAGHAMAQTAAAEQLGSRTARAGFRNEDEIASKFSNWKTDPEARSWLAFMGYRADVIRSVTASKPHGEKADVVITVETPSGRRSEGISIKLVSTANGFNQIDKRWLRSYAALWNMPGDVRTALSYYVGETAPRARGRDAERMYLDELEPKERDAVVRFFSSHKAEVLNTLFGGEGEFAAGWMLVAQKASPTPRWVLRRMEYVTRSFGEGPVEITRQGNLKIGRVTMQRKGGDAGRESAKMLQFKVNPALLFDK